MSGVSQPAVPTWCPRQLQLVEMLDDEVVRVVEPTGSPDWGGGRRPERQRGRGELLGVMILGGNSSIVIMIILLIVEGDPPPENITFQNVTYKLEARSCYIGYSHRDIISQIELKERRMRVNS